MYVVPHLYTFSPYSTFFSTFSVKVHIPPSSPHFSIQVHIPPPFPHFQSKSIVHLLPIFVSSSYSIFFHIFVSSSYSTFFSIFVSSSYSTFFHIFVSSSYSTFFHIFVSSSYSTFFHIFVSKFRLFRHFQFKFIFHLLYIKCGLRSTGEEGVSRVLQTSGRRIGSPWRKGNIPSGRKEFVLSWGMGKRSPSKYQLGNAWQ